MRDLELEIFIWAAAGLAWLLAIVPVLYYLGSNSGWKMRKQRILLSFKESALDKYYKLYFPARKKLVADNAATFEADYRKYYGRKHFVVPVILLSLISAIGLWGAAQTTLVWLGASAGLKALPAMAVSSIMGAYTWVIYDQLRRLRSGDFARGDVGNAAFRFVIAVPFGYALGVFDPTFGVGLAFLVGVFPTRTLFTFGRRLFNQQFKMGEAGSKGTSELEQLQNVGRTVAERFQDEGITTIAQLAWNDPIDMTIRTNLDFNFVVDCMSQSLLAIYVGSDLQKLAKYSLRGAQEVTALLDALKGSADGDSDEQGGTEGKIALGPAPRPLPARGAGTSTAVLIRRKMKLRWKERMRRLGRQAMVAAIAPGQIVARAKGAGQFVDCDVAAAEAALKGAAAALGIDALSLYYTLTCVAEDPYSKFLWEIWGD
ncbi:MAG: hypothetical protein ABSF29_15750 [Tepidisphaeraceae bacterium]